jgi:hypothetical protein
MLAAAASVIATGRNSKLLEFLPLAAAASIGYDATALDSDVCVYYCSTYYKAFREGGGGEVEDMCYERLRAEAYDSLL